MHAGSPRCGPAAIAAHNGILAALLAQSGLTGPVAVLEGRRGFCAAFTDGHYDATALEQELGERYLILDAAFKLHNTAHVWALPLDALAILRAQHGFSAADVEKIVVTFPQNWTAIMDDPSGATYAPANYAQATNNLRFCLAVGLHEGQVYLEQFHETRRRNPAILETAQRVIPRPDAELAASLRAPIPPPPISACSSSPGLTTSCTSIIRAAVRRTRRRPPSWERNSRR